MSYLTRKQQDDLEKTYSDQFSIWKSELSGQFTILPNNILYGDFLTDGEKMFLFKLMGMANTGGCLYHGNETLSEKLGCKVDNVAKYLRLLKKKKMLVTLTVGTNVKRVICLTPYN